MRALLVIACLFLTLPCMGQIAVTEGSGIDLQAINVPIAYSASIVHDSTTGWMVAGVTDTVPISLENFRYSSATIQVASGTTYAGAIGSASFEVLLSPSETSGMEAPVYTARTDTGAFVALGTITNYGTYQVPLYGARWMVIRAHGADDYTRQIKVGLR